MNFFFSVKRIKFMMQFRFWRIFVFFFFFCGCIYYYYFYVLFVRFRVNYYHGFCRSGIQTQVNIISKFTAISIRGSKVLGRVIQYKNITLESEPCFKFGDRDLNTFW